MFRYILNYFKRPYQEKGIVLRSGLEERDNSLLWCVISMVVLFGWLIFSSNEIDNLHEKNTLLTIENTQLVIQNLQLKQQLINEQIR